MALSGGTRGVVERGKSGRHEGAVRACLVLRMRLLRHFQCDTCGGGLGGHPRGVVGSSGAPADGAGAKENGLLRRLAQRWHGGAISQLAPGAPRRSRARRLFRALFCPAVSWSDGGGAAVGRTMGRSGGRCGGTERSAGKALCPAAARLDGQAGPASDRKACCRAVGRSSGRPIGRSVGGRLVGRTVGWPAAESGGWAGRSGHRVVERSGRSDGRPAA